MVGGSKNAIIMCHLAFLESIAAMKFKCHSDLLLQCRHTFGFIESNLLLEFESTSDCSSHLSLYHVVSAEWVR